MFFHDLDRTSFFCAGRVISGYHVNDTWHSFAKGNPLWPQVQLNISTHVHVQIFGV